MIRFTIITPDFPTTKSNLVVHIILGLEGKDS